MKAYAALGRTDEAERVLADAEERSGRCVALHGPQLMIAKSWLAAAKGFDRRALELARAAADAAHQSGQYAVEAEALHHAARFGDRTVAGRLAALAEHVNGRVVRLQARHAAAVAAADGEALDAVSAEFEDAGLLLSAADSAAQAAPLHDRAGQRRKSVESAARALRLATRCGGSGDAGDQSRGATPTGDLPRAGDRRADCRGTVEPGNCRAADGVGSYGRRPRVPCVLQTRCRRPRRTCQAHAVGVIQIADTLAHLTPTGCSTPLIAHRPHQPSRLRQNVDGPRRILGDATGATSGTVRQELSGTWIIAIIHERPITLPAPAIKHRLIAGGGLHPCLIGIRLGRAAPLRLVIGDRSP